MTRINTNNTEMLDLYFAKMEDESIALTLDQQKRFERLQDAYTHWLSNPVLPDNRIRDYIMSMYGVTTRIAYQDIAIIKSIFGRVPLANRELMRIKANHLLDMAAAAAQAGNDRKANAFTKIADSIIRNNRLDDKEENDMPWDEIVPKDISISIDPSVIGIEPVPDVKEKAARLLKQYTSEIDGGDIVIPDGDREEIL